MSLFKSAFTVGSFTLFSRILGYVRDILIASSLGASVIADAFFVAFRLPNFFRQLSAEGAFNAAFVPLFSQKLEEKGKDKARNFAEQAMSFMFFALLALTILMEIFMPAVMHVLAPGFVDNPEKFGLSVEFARILFPYLIFISLVSLFSGILNSIGKFAVPASAPIILNLCMITGLLFFTQYFSTSAHTLSWAVAIAGLLQFLWLFIIAHKNGFKITLRRPKINDNIKTLLKRMVPGIIGGGVTQINLWVNTVIATTMASAVSYLYYADRLVQFPLAIIGTAMGTALLPNLSRQIKKQDIDGAINTQNKAVEITMLFTIPAATALFVIADNLIGVMFQRGAFTSIETLATAKALQAYSVGLPAFVLIKIFAPVFFANSDTKTPVKIAAICLVANVTISLSLIGHIGYIGLAVATSSAAWLNSILLLILLKKRELYVQKVGILVKIVKILICASFMGGVLYFAEIELGKHFSDSFWDKITSLILLIFSGLVSYFLLISIIGGYRKADVSRLVR